MEQKNRYIENKNQNGRCIPIISMIMDEAIQSKGRACQTNIQTNKQQAVFSTGDIFQVQGCE